MSLFPSSSPLPPIADNVPAYSFHDVENTIEGTMGHVIPPILSHQTVLNQGINQQDGGVHGMERQAKNYQGEGEGRRSGLTSMQDENIRFMNATQKKLHSTRQDVGMSEKMQGSGQFNGVAVDQPVNQKKIPPNLQNEAVGGQMDYNVFLTYARKLLRDWETMHGAVDSQLKLNMFISSHPHAQYCVEILQHEAAREAEKIRVASAAALDAKKRMEHEIMDVVALAEKDLVLREIYLRAYQHFKIQISNSKTLLDLREYYNKAGLAFVDQILTHVLTLPSLPFGLMRLPQSQQVRLPPYGSKSTSSNYKPIIRREPPKPMKMIAPHIKPAPVFKRDYMPITEATMPLVRKLLADLKSLDVNGYFYQPVDRKLFPVYYQVIAEPISLSIIGQKLSRGQYRLFSALEADLELIVQNCHHYNSPDSPIFLAANLFWEAALPKIHECGDNVFSMYTKSGVALVDRSKPKAETKPNEIKRKERAASQVIVFEALPERDWDSIQLNTFETIGSYLPVIDHDLVMQKLKTSRLGHCTGTHCHSIMNLGPFDSAISDSGGFVSSCSDRYECVECSSSCECDPASCQNRAIASNQRKRLGEHVIQRLTYGIDSFTRHVMLKSMPPDVSEDEGEIFLQTKLLPQINQHNPNNLNKFPVGDMLIALRSIHSRATLQKDEVTQNIAFYLLDQMVKSYTAKKSLSGSRLLLDEWPIYPKGMGVVCIAPEGIKQNELVAEYYGEVYPSWRWFEKEEVLKLKVKKADRVDEFYNIMLERHRNDQAGYDVLFVDPIRKGNFASRMSHSCDPNCSTVVMASGGHYVIGMFAVKDIGFSEELTFDYNSVTESNEEYKSSICLCASKSCRGSFLSLVGADTFDQIMQREHSILHRIKLLYNACTMHLDEVDRVALENASFRSSILDGLPEWCVKYAAYVIQFAETERLALPDVMVHEAEKFNAEMLNTESIYNLETASHEAKGVFLNRLQNLAITLDRVKHVLRQPGQNLNPPLFNLCHEVVCGFLWNNPDSVVLRFFSSIRIHLNSEQVDYLGGIVSQKIATANYSVLKSNFLLLASFCHSLPPTPYAFHHAAGDLFILYANTDFWFSENDYLEFRSPPFHYTELGLKSVPKISNREKLEAPITAEEKEREEMIISNTEWRTCDISGELGRGKRSRKTVRNLDSEEVDFESKPKRRSERKAESTTVHLIDDQKIEKGEEVGVVSNSLEIKSEEKIKMDLDDATIDGKTVSNREVKTDSDDVERKYKEIAADEAGKVPDGYVESCFYPSQFIWSALSYWYKPTTLNPWNELAIERKNAVSLPFFDGCYSRNRQTVLKRSYNAEERSFFLEKLSSDPLSAWTYGPWVWNVRYSFKCFGSLLMQPHDENWNAMISALKNVDLNWEFYRK